MQFFEHGNCYVIWNNTYWLWIISKYMLKVGTAAITIFAAINNREK